MKKSLVLASAFFVLAAAFLLAGQPVFAAKLDFGDAPDGYKAYASGTKGNYPSKLLNDGARAQKTNKVWLGGKVDKEKNSKQINRDLHDDGFQFKGKSYKSSKAVFLVHKAKKSTKGTVYLNAWFDFNRDGDWDDSKEWGVRNFPVKLKLQKKKVKPYVVRLKAGKRVKNIVMRATVSYKQRMTGYTGVISKGEVEDYAPNGMRKKGAKPKYAAYCDPKPLLLKHGKSGQLKIKKKMSSKTFASVDLFNSPAATAARTITKNGNDTFVFGDTKVDGPARIENFSPQFQVKWKNGKTRVVSCKVKVYHQKSPLKKQNKYEKEVNDVNGAAVRHEGVIHYELTPTSDNHAYNAVEFPLNGQMPAMPEPDDFWFVANSDYAYWPCSLVSSSHYGGQAVRCSGVPLRSGENSTLTLYYANQWNIPGSLTSLHMNVYNGNALLGAVNAPLVVE